MQKSPEKELAKLLLALDLAEDDAEAQVAARNLLGLSCTCCDIIFDEQENDERKDA